MPIDLKKYARNGELDLHGQKDINFDELAIFIKDNPEITKLDVACCSIRQWENDQSELLVKAIEGSNITYLNVENNSLNIKSAENISELTQITHLNIANNDIFFEGMQHILKLPNLTYLNTKDNSIGDGDGVLFMAKVLEENRTLTEINLTTYSIDNAQAKAIAKALLKNNTLTSINADNISYDDDVKDTVKEYINKKLQHNKEIKDISEAFKAIISEITLKTDGTPLLSLDTEGSEQNSFLKTLQEYSERYGAFPLPVLEQSIAQSLYQDTVHVHKDGTEQLSFATRSDTLIKVIQAILARSGFKEEDINEFNSKIVEIIEEVKEMFVLELDILNLMDICEINTETKELDSTHLPPILSYHEFTMRGEWQPLFDSNVNVESLNEQQKAELKNNQQLTSLYQQFPDLKTPGIILQKTIKSAIDGVYIGDVATLLKENKYEQTFKHKPLIQKLLNKFIELNNISEIESQESPLASEQTASLETILKQYFDTYPSNVSEHTQIDSATAPITPDLMGDSLYTD
ncbi:MAG: hypothetical protein LN563_04790 [Rickettsia endosymbiont of Platyusa sonomae]|nr:hypothetical protein [Rickettsia endosymbiont of Platyusa sonomae]